MPIRYNSAHRAPIGTLFAGAITWLRSPRSCLGALALALLVPFAPTTLAATPAAAAPARCGTWTSEVTPPPSIRVLRTATGVVEEVPFATYVATVMASGEWPTSLPPAVLQAGATAAKQFAWYYTLKGNHRADYHTKGGACYDVVDTTQDQLYRPETAHPTQKQLDALAATWALSLRKHGRFFLTGYRAGSNVSCAHDADGWRLYEASITHCAKQGWSRVRIQQRYYAPHLGFVWDYAKPAVTAAAVTAATATDRKAPIALAPKLQLRTGASLGGRLGIVRWAGADAGSGLSGFQVQERIDGGPWTDITPAQARARRTGLTLDPTVRYEIRVRAVDGAGNVSEWAPSDTSVPAVVESGATVHTHGWTAVQDASASGGSVLRTGKAGASMGLRFHGSTVAIVAPTGQAYGRVRIRVGGAVVATVDLGRQPASDGRVIWTKAWHGDRNHHVGLVVLNAPGADRVDVDAFVVVR